jgi:hypothetical protein
MARGIEQGQIVRDDHDRKDFIRQVCEEETYFLELVRQVKALVVTPQALYAASNRGEKDAIIHQRQRNLERWFAWYVG